MRQLQHVTHQLDRWLRANSRTERSRNDERNVGLHVLGRGVSCNAARLHNASEFMRGRRWSWRNDVWHSHPDATAASKLITRMTTGQARRHRGLPAPPFIKSA